MKKFLAVFCLVLLFFTTSAASAFAYTTVKGYYKKNGTYVHSYVRSNPNGLKYDNYSYKPSQPRYNPSYYSTGRSSYWTTPSYVTDPYYYSGKSIYNSNKY